MKTRQNTPADTKGNPVPQKDITKGNNRGRRFNKPRPPRNFWKTMLTNKFFDLLVLVIGLSIVYAIYSAKIAHDNSNRKDFYKKNLVNDLDRDIEELNKNIQELKYDNQVVVSYVQQYSQGEVVGDSLASVVVAILSLDTFNGNDNTYQALISSNSLISFSDPADVSLIAEFYNQYKSISRFEESYNRSIGDVNEYFSSKINYALRKIVDRSILNSERTKNCLLLSAAQLETGIEQYEEALSLAKQLRKHLE